MLVQVPAWHSFSWLRHGFSTRLGGVSKVYVGPATVAAEGDLNLGWTKDDDPANVSENRRRLLDAVRASSNLPVSLVTVRQVHSALTLTVPDPSIQSLSTFVTPEGKALLEADGLLTNTAGILLGIQTADCVPVFVVDTRLRIVANFHAGWRGTAVRIVETGVAKMVADFGSRPGDLIAAIGPSIGACCYSVGEEVHQTFTSRFTYAESLFTRTPDPTSPLHLDLWGANAASSSTPALPQIASPLLANAPAAPDSPAHAAISLTAASTASPVACSASSASPRFLRSILSLDVTSTAVPGDTHCLA